MGVDHVPRQPQIGVWLRVWGLFYPPAAAQPVRVTHLWCGATGDLCSARERVQIPCTDILSGLVHTHARKNDGNRGIWESLCLLALW